ncbi:MAG: EAL domain-containing protein [Hyphomicrobium sp.]|uniref:putative bifunctional diguanylate cyclase/phosphodiesterase n=1 Tax=Hyphomicrobium sp. TaxID=82 RepID=UPI0039E3A750
MAQYSAFSKQMPLLYIVLIANTWLLAFTFIDTAPRVLALYIPIFLTIVCAVRIAAWTLSIGRSPTKEIAFLRLSRANKLAAILSIGFATWAISLFPYGDAIDRAQIAFYMAITVIACIFCLMSLRSAAFSTTIIVNGIFIAFFGFSGNPNFVAITINMVLVTMSMMVSLSVNYKQLTQLVIARDDAQKLMSANFKLANLDPLTELPNRRQFFGHLDREFSRVKAEDKKLAVGVMDLDGFKPVNDRYGHAVGDALLIEVGRRLKEACGNKLHLARIGGDEFAVIATDFKTEHELLASGIRLCEALRSPIFLDDATVQVSGSIGFAIYPDLAASATALFERADYALFKSKREQRGQATLFSVEDRAELQREADIEQALHAAELDKELTVVFQPIVDIDTNEPVAFEALARWNSPTLGPLSPALFIPIAERLGFVSKLTYVLFDKALAAASQWPQHMRMSFNLSAYDICATESVVRLVSTVLKSGFDPKRLDFEITETAIMQDFKEACETIEIFRSLGCGISLDDFGTGYSSLTQLNSLPLTKIKIDRTFVTDLHISPANHKIVKSLLALSRDMGLGCVVEGVEKIDELEALKAIGCTTVQGYLFAPPLDKEDVLEFLQANGRTPSASMIA